MKVLFYIALFVIFINFSAGMAQNNPEMEKLSWIIDRWVSASEGDTRSYEHWEKINDGLFAGGSETLKNGDTIFAEKLKIEKIGDDIFYIADVKHNPAPVMFKMTWLNDNEAVFENPEHDFPQKISYKLEEGILHAAIEGPGKKGEWRKVDFVMNRMR
jgi:hypothetical protein